MKINWKEVVNHKQGGYRTIKLGMIDYLNHTHNARYTVTQKLRMKTECHEVFRKIISLAISIHNRTSTPIENILYSFAANQDCNWINYYGRIPNMYETGKPKPMGIKGIIRYHKEQEANTVSWGMRTSKARIKERMNDAIKHFNKQNSKRKGRKARWSKERKARQARIKVRNL